MFRIDNPTAATTLPAPAAAGTPGFFTDGNPGAGTPATIVPADWLNIVQEELNGVVVAAGLTPSKTNNAQLLAAIQHLGKTSNEQAIQSSTSITVPAGVYRYKARVWGGGAGGGASSGSNSAGSGGGGGGYTEGYIPVTPGSTLTITVGAGGASNMPTTGNGFPGGTSSIGALSATGGTGGTGASSSIPLTTGAGGAGSGGSLNLPGSAAGIGIVYPSSQLSGGLGGASFCGSSPQPNVTAAPAAGNTGFAPGTGGNGGTNGGSGGTGVNGLVILEW